MPNEEKVEFGHAVKHAIRRALRQTASPSIDVRWCARGSIIVCIELELPYALRLPEFARMVILSYGMNSACARATWASTAQGAWACLPR